MTFKRSFRSLTAAALLLLSGCGTDTSAPGAYVLVGAPTVSSGGKAGDTYATCSVLIRTETKPAITLNGSSCTYDSVRGAVSLATAECGWLRFNPARLGKYSHICADCIVAHQRFPACPLPRELDMYSLVEQ